VRLPFDFEAERALLGALLERPAGWVEVVGVLEADDFWEQEHREVFDAIATVAPSFDTVSVSAEMRRRSKDPLILADLIEACPMPIHARRYARAVVRVAQQRRLIEALSNALDRAAADGAEPSMIGADVEVRVRELGAREQGAIAIGEVMDDLLEDLESSYQATITTGLFDEMLDGGLWPGRLYLIGARPGVGKTALAGNLALRAVTRNRRVLFVTLEMSRHEVAVRMLQDHASLPHIEVRRESNLVRLTETAVLWPLEFLEAPMSVAEIAVRARATKPDLVIVDYIQLLMPAVRRESRATEVAEMSRDLKILARELDVPILACAQVNRDPEKGANREPKLSDLRESGALEADADVVLLLHAKDQYERKAILAKNRHGPPGEKSLAFKARFARFEEGV
jgi:replicative DNA helicase